MKGRTMKAFKDIDLSKWIDSLKEHAVKTHIPEPKVINHNNLEKAGLLTREVVNGVPKINVNLLESCQYNGCTPSHSGIHTRQEVREVDDLKAYMPIFIKDDQGNEVEDTSKRPDNLIIDDDGMWQPIKLKYSFGCPCHYCGLTNKYLLRFKSSGLTADAIGKHIANYHFEEGLEEKALKFVNGSIRGGIVFGRPGNGKTHLLCGLARELIWRGKKVRYVSHQHLIEQISKSINKENNTVDPRFSWLDGVDVIMFDELGFFRKNEWSKQITNELIHAIHASNVQVLFASNLTPKQMMNQFLDERSISRIGEMCGQFRHEMISHDRRTAEGFWQ